MRARRRTRPSRRPEVMGSALVEQAERLSRDGKWDEAAAAYHAAVLADPTDAEAMILLASAYDRTKRPAEAKAMALYAALTFLGADYDAVAALKVNPRLFAERHEVAQFCGDHLAAIHDAVCSPQKKRDQPTMVFAYWDSTSLPRVVELCRRSLREHCGPGVELHELDDDNVGDYVKVSRKITKKFETNKAYFSDYLRSNLLRRYGGLWVDSTVLMTGDVGETLKPLSVEDGFFHVYSGSRVASWFMWSRPAGYISSALAAAMDLWWSRDDARLTNYFMFHDFVEMLYWVDPIYRETWERMPKVHPRNALALLDNLNKPYDPAAFRRLLSKSRLHKLTHKYPPSVEHGGTNLERLLTV